MSTHNICFCVEIRALCFRHSLLSRATTKLIMFGHRVGLEVKITHNVNKYHPAAVLSLRASSSSFVQRLAPVESINSFWLKNVFILTILSELMLCESITPTWLQYWRQYEDNSINKLNDIRLLMASNMASAMARGLGMGSSNRKRYKIHHTVPPAWHETW